MSNPVFSAVSAAEGDMLKVYDFALLLHEFLSRKGSITLDEQHALTWLTAELMNIGQALQEHSSQLYQVARRSA